ncbi:Zinc finger C2H2 superfamily [Sesbania bispinosa]|nr:Zinc finger C2H2 superfamily [Sesbania bispinosa]
MGFEARERWRRLGSERSHRPYECKLCLTLHNNEGNYLAHTQGKRHQTNLAKRAAREAKDAPAQPQPHKRKVSVRKTVKIGRPGYRVTKQYDPETKQRSLLFQIEYPEIEDNMKPRHRFMSSYEQRVQPFDKRYQYLLFAAEPYEIVAFKVPSTEIDKSTPKFFSHWDPDSKMFTLQLYFKSKPPEATKPQPASTANGAAAPGSLPPPPPMGVNGPRPAPPGGMPSIPPPPPLGSGTASFNMGSRPPLMPPPQGPQFTYTYVHKACVVSETGPHWKGLTALEQGKLFHGYILRWGLDSILPVLNTLITIHTCLVEEEMFYLNLCLPSTGSIQAWSIMLVWIHCNVEIAERASAMLFELEPMNAGNYVLLAEFM